MSITKKIVLVFFVLFGGISIWYLFIKANDFEVVIKVKSSPGTVYQNILDWNTNLNMEKTRAVIEKKEPFHRIVHTYDFELHKLVFDWNMDQTNDSITRITIGINDLNHSIGTRVKKLFGMSPVQELLHQEFSGFNQVLTKYLKGFRVEVIGEAYSPETYVAYVHIVCDQREKANNMISNSAYINTFLVDHGMKLQSNPFNEITDWNIDTGQLSFNFCFPISKQTNFPFHEEIKCKKITAKKSIKATFFGNYSYSQSAWYVLHEYLKNKKIESLNTITEVFYDNPHTGGKDVTWKAGVFMEIK